MADTIIAEFPPSDGRDWESQCARCGSSCTRVDCDGCAGEGYFEVYEEDPINNDPDDVESCRTCRGYGGWWACLSSSDWCQQNPAPGRELVAQGLVEWFTSEVARG